MLRFLSSSQIISEERRNMVQTEVREILHNVVTPGSKSKYDNANTIFVLWLYKSLKYLPYLFPPVILEELDRANEAEQANGQ